MKGKFLNRRKKIITIPTLTLIMMSLAITSSPSSAFASTLTEDDIAYALKEMPATIEVVYEEVTEKEPTTIKNTSSKKGSSLSEFLENVEADSSTETSTEAEDTTPWYETQESIDYYAEQAKTWTPFGGASPITNLSNHPELRLRMENKLGLPLIISGSNSSIYTDYSERQLKEIEGQAALHNKYIYDAISENKDYMSFITKHTLGLEQNCKSSFIIPWFVYHGQLDNDRVALPSSLTDSICREDMNQLICKYSGELSKTSKESPYNSRFIFQQQIAEAISKISTTPKDERANYAIYAKAGRTGTFFDYRDLSNKDLNSSFTRMEAIYNLVDTEASANSFGTGTGQQMNNYTVYHNNLSVPDQYQSFCKDVTKTFAISDVPLDSVRTEEDIEKDYENGLVNDLSAEYGMHVGIKDKQPVTETITEKVKTGTKKVKVKKRNKKGKIVYKKVTKKVKKKTNKYRLVKVLDMKKGKVVTKKKYIYKIVKKKVKQPVYITKKVPKYKTVTKENVKAVKVTLYDEYFTEENIQAMRDTIAKGYTDGSSYKILSVDELEQVKEQIGYYKTFAQNNIALAKSKLHAYCVQNKVLSPDMAAPIVLAYESGWDITSEGTTSGSLNLWADTTYDDIIYMCSYNLH